MHHGGNNKSENQDASVRAFVLDVRAWSDVFQRGWYRRKQEGDPVTDLRRLL